MLNRIQKQFVKLVNTNTSKWMSMPRRSMFRSRYRVKKWAPSSTQVKIINAVTGEETTARAYDDSPTTLKRWLKMRNLRAQFADMVIFKNSIWAQLSDEEIKDYPVIVKMGKKQYPYLIDHIGDRLTFGKKTTATVFLKTVENINYLSVIAEKRALLSNIAKPIKKVVKKKRKK
jgi:hypothetical protein